MTESPLVQREQSEVSLGTAALGRRGARAPGGIVRMAVYAITLGLPLHGLVMRFVPAGQLWKETLLIGGVYVLILVGLMTGRVARPTGRRRLRNADLLVLCFVCYVGARALLAQDTTAGAIGFGTYTLYIVYYFLVISVFDEAMIESLTAVALVAALVVDCIGVVQVTLDPTVGGLVEPATEQLIGGSSGTWVPRAKSVVGSPLYLGAYLAMVVPFAFARWLRARQQRATQLLYLGSLVLLALTIALTYTRAAWMQTILAVGVFLWFAKGDRGVRRRLAVLGVVTAVVAMGTWVVLTYSGPLERAERQLPPLAVRMVSAFDWRTEPANVLRMAWWREALAHMDSPGKLLFGIGPGLMMPRTAYYAQRTVGGAESFYLQLLVETGIVGLLLFCGVLIGFIRRGVTLVRSSLGPRERLGALAAVSAIIGAAGAFVVGAHLNSWEVAMMFWFSCAYLITMENAVVTPHRCPDHTTPAGCVDPGGRPGVGHAR